MSSLQPVSRPVSYRLASAVALVLSTNYINVAVANPAAGSAYFTDAQSSHVEDATSKDIGTVNMIACIMSAMRPDQLVNQGNYIALVDETKCDQNSRSSTSQSGGSGSGGQSEFMTALVNSTRATNSDPMLAKIWINQSEEGESLTIFVRTQATSAPTASNPYGVFRLDFCGHADADSSSNCMMKGSLDAQAGSLSFYEEEGGGGDSTIKALRLTSVGTGTGSGKLSRTETRGGNATTESFAFAFDQNNFLRDNQCFSRDASDPGTGLSVWRYGLYDATTGDRIVRNSGFPIEYTTGGSTYHGYLGYWGLQLPPDAGTIVSGATVNKVDYNAGSTPTTTPYTVVKSNGKLTRYTRRGTTLDQLDKIKLNTFVGNNVAGFFSGAAPNTTYELYWDNTAGNFKVTGHMSCGGNGCQTQTLPSEQTVAASFFVAQGGLQGWSQALGGEVFVKLGGIVGAVQPTTVIANYRVQDMVYPADLPATLYCVNNCPTAATMGAYFAQGSSAQSPFTTATANNFNPTAAGNVVTYTSDAVAADLKDNTATSVTFTDAAALQARPHFTQGVRTGRLFTSLAAAECSLGSGTYCDYKVNEADVYYQWETGANNWNQFAAVKNSSGNIVQFDAPLQVNYNVPSGVQYGQYAGKSIVLQYGGFGDLWGIPGQCVSRLTNQPLSCENQEARYVPEFVIPMSDTTGVVTSGSANYLVKWLDREIRFASKNLSVCAALAIPTNVTLPTASGLLNPADPASSAYIGVKPTVTGAPRVIHGDVKY